MNRYIQKFGEFLMGPDLFGQQPERVELRQLVVRFLKSKKEILRHLHRCKTSGGLLGVYCEAFGKGMFLTTVEDIDEAAGEVYICFKPYDVSGRFMERSEVALSEIDAICPFNQMYVEPRSYDLGLRDSISSIFNAEPISRKERL